MREQRLAQVAQELASPGGLALRAIRPLIYGADHPYAAASSAGDSAAIAAIAREDMAAEHARWIRPDLATITAVGDVTMPELMAAKPETSFGDWQVPAAAAPVKSVDQPAPAPAQKLVVIDRPNSPSSYLMLGRLAGFSGAPAGIETVEIANEVLGSGFLSRLMGDLRETKGWTYGISSGFAGAKGPRSFAVSTEVQADRTADLIRAILAQMAAYPAIRPVDAIELQRVTQGNIRSLPNRFETNAQVLGALLTNALYGRDDRYQTQLPAIYRGVDAAALNAAAAEYLQPQDLAIVVVGDRRVIHAQLATLGMPIEYLDLSEAQAVDLDRYERRIIPPIS